MPVATTKLVNVLGELVIDIKSIVAVFDVDGQYYVLLKGMLKAEDGIPVSSAVASALVDQYLLEADE